MMPSDSSMVSPDDNEYTGQILDFKPGSFPGTFLIDDFISKYYDPCHRI